MAFSVNNVGLKAIHKFNFVVAFVPTDHTYVFQTPLGISHSVGLTTHVSNKIFDSRPNASPPI